MKRLIVTAAFSILALTAGLARGQEYLPESMKTHPEWYLKISDWSVYATWSAVAIIQGVTIENTSDITYKDVKVRVTFTSNTAGSAGAVVSQEDGVLPITVPARSKETYLKAGYPLGAGSQFMNPLAIEVLGATPVLNCAGHPRRPPTNHNTPHTLNYMLVGPDLAPAAPRLEP